MRGWFQRSREAVFTGAAFADCAAFVQRDRLPQAGVIDRVATGAKGVGVVSGAGEHDVVTAIAAQDVVAAIAFEPVSGVAAIDIFKVLNVDADRANPRQAGDLQRIALQISIEAGCETATSEAINPVTITSAGFDALVEVGEGVSALAALATVPPRTKRID